MDEIREIVQYGAKWDLDEHFGWLWLKDNMGAIHEEKVESPEELYILVHLLQTEKPIFYHVDDHYISTSLEDIGIEGHSNSNINNSR